MGRKEGGRGGRKESRVSERSLSKADELQLNEEEYSVSISIPIFFHKRTRQGLNKLDVNSF